ncbi:tetratricopeptide repeat protein 24 [Synchiropus splendidus]|uniref:tetratricopeptide repeat protein 24 n=1 Tax=Synchiropus splendidus TaxID=270530 RepID=UPI00237D4E8D|nr:tetratricopeptide repeat protein 24 [Synchiropus splendidus]
MASDSAPENEEIKRRRNRREKKKKKEVSEDESLEIQILTGQGHQALQEGRPEDALRCFKGALQAAGQLQDSRLLRVCSFNLGAAYVEADEPQTGLDLLRRAQPGPKAQRLPDLQFNLAVAHNALGHHLEAAGHFLHAAQLYSSQGDALSEAEACMQMSQCYSKERMWSPAASGFLRAAQSYNVALNHGSAADALKEASGHMIHSEQFSRDDIISTLEECQSLSEKISDSEALGEILLAVGGSFCQLRCFQEAAQCFLQALDSTPQQSLLRAKALHNLGASLNALGDFTAAVQYHRLATGLYGWLGLRGDQARCFSNLAVACSSLHQHEGAAESWTHALQGFRDTGDPWAQVQVCESLAECYLRQQKPVKAVHFYKQALAALTCCQESSGSAQDRLVDRLSAALQRSLTVRQKRSTRPGRPPGGHTRMCDSSVRSPRATCEHSTSDSQGETHMCHDVIMSAERGRSPGQEATTPGPPSLGRSDHHQLGESWSEGENLPTDSAASFIQEVPAASLSDIPQTVPPLARWRSRFCSVM